ncbi:NF-kappa-B inhibitor cactus-like [Helicoverpa zea]|uniref:NF-kappa-B inhibitor cactus-like n=1 Tax=Helicoverpa zea TaxID=7113 RepID=UPI001F5630F0|nr:NF-kappa-B inhibitor cactus-like [Helicoverpa zea]
MSGNKRINFDTKITEDENIDSGFLSGPLDVYPGDEEDKEAERQSASEDKKVLSDSAVQPSDSELDSGILCLSECLSGVQLTDTQTPHIEVSPPEQKNLPPIVIFFQQDADGDTQLHIASVHGCEKSVGTLIRVCPNKALLDVANDDGHTPLHLAVMSGNAVVTRMLVHAGLSLGARDRKGETPLHKATTKGHIECLQALLAPVPEHPRTKLSSVLDQKNYKGQACVHLAASSGNIEALQTLVYYGADINLRENLAGSTALHIAARRGDARLAQFLLERGAAPQPRDYASRTPRRLARHTAAARAFTNLSADDSDSDTDDDDDMYDSDSGDSLFERLRESMSSNNVNLKGCC